MTEKDEVEILELYFKKMKSYTELEEIFKGKYTYRDFKRVITNYYKKYQR